jgi:catechol 2,3-dioxygenase-like lactoylglutathione lyase family enzyme
MKIEHIAFNVADPVAVAAWYCQHCGLRIVRHVPKPAQTHFLADSDATVLEIYCNPPDQVPDYRNINPLLFHLALASADPDADTERLVSAGAVLVEEIRLPDGSQLVMLRDPWGVALQLCKRASSLLPDLPTAKV